MPFLPQSAAIRLILTALLIFNGIFSAAAAQEEADTTPSLPRETLQIIVTTRDITIGTNFSGADLYIAGAAENMDILLRRQNRYDIIAVLEGEQKNTVLYEKKRRFGVWINGAAALFTHVPQFYALASTRELRDITTPQTYQNLHLGLAFLPIHSRRHLKASEKIAYRQELIKLKQKQGFYAEETGSVSFGTPQLFSARFRLPDNIPVGSYSVKVYLFRDGIFSAEASEQLTIRRTNFTYSLYYAAHKHAAGYGFAAVCIALFFGLGGRVIFRK